MKSQIGLILLALLAGAFVPLQTGANAMLSKGLGNGVLSTLVVFIVAAITTLVFLLLGKPLVPSLGQLTQITWYSWVLGGVLGAGYIYLLIYTSPKLGMAGTVGFVVGGQLIVAILFDHFGWMNFVPHAINWKRIAGVMLLIAGVIIIKKY